SSLQLSSVLVPSCFGLPSSFPPLFFRLHFILIRHVIPSPFRLRRCRKNQSPEATDRHQTNLPARRPFSQIKSRSHTPTTRPVTYVSCYTTILGSLAAPQHLILFRGPHGQSCLFPLAPHLCISITSKPAQAGLHSLYMTHSNNRLRL